MMASLAYIVLSPLAHAQEQCDWYGREVIPLCEAAQTGWAREDGIRCISRDECINGQPSNRGGIVGGGNNDGGNNDGGNNGSADQCNTTAQCRAIYGNGATDCLDSRSDNSVCMCGGSRCDADDGGNNGGGNDGDVPQPPSSCSNINNSIPNNISLHTILDRSISRSEFGDFTRWYTEDGNRQRFQLKNGDQNQTSSILRPRVEAYVPNSGRWTRGNGSTWHEYSANYYLEDWDEPQLYAIFQIKTNDSSNFIIQGLIEKDGSLQFARRSKGRVRIANDVYRKPFHLRVRSNGFKFEVYLNCELVLAENHPQPQLESGSTQYGFRWGLYRQQADDDKHDGTTTMYVTGVKFN